MAERRQGERRPFRTRVRFAERGGEKSHTGFTTNISDSGVFMTTNHLVAQGKRVRLELGAAAESAVVEAVVTRVSRSLHQIRPSGLGVRFLRPDEVLREVTSESGGKRDGIPEDAGTSLYRLRFKHRQQLAEVYERDLVTGGLFIPTQEPAPLNETISVEISVADVAAAPTRMKARVVHRLEPGAGPLTGMGVEILDAGQALESVRRLLGLA